MHEVLLMMFNFMIVILKNEIINFIN